ncbi:1,4-alpha-glucan branching enzyme [Planomonospora algeriensis]
MRIGSTLLRRARPVPGDESRRLAAGEHHDPHSLLGPHAGSGGITIRVFQPTAERVVVRTPRERFPLLDEGMGLFAGTLPWREVPEYRLETTIGGVCRRTDDPYRFRPLLGELDLHLIEEGRHERLWQVLGAHVRTVASAAGEVTGTSFAVWAPRARGVRVAGDFNGWDGAAHAMRSMGGSGVWGLFVPGVGDGCRYAYEILGADGRRHRRADPLAAAACPSAAASVVFTSGHRWQDDAWMRRRALAVPYAEPMSVYEVHLGSWRPGLTYRELADALPGYVGDLGFTHVEFLPPAGHPSDGGPGSRAESYFTPAARLGDPDDFRHLVDRLHQAGIGVIVDWAPGRFAGGDRALTRFDGAPLYERPGPHRAGRGGGDLLPFDLGRPGVRNFLVASALSWCAEFHVDGLRVTGVERMLHPGRGREDGNADRPEGEDPDALALLRELNATLRRHAPGAVTIADGAGTWSETTALTHSGGLGFGFAWNLGWVRDSLGYLGRDPAERAYHHGELTFSLAYAHAENHVLPLGRAQGALVSRIAGERWQRFACLRAYLGFAWAHPGKQLLAMGQEFAQEGPWPAGAGPAWESLSRGEHRAVRDLVRDLNRVYRDSPALWRLDAFPAGFRWVDADAAEENMVVFLRYGDARDAPLVSVCNFSPVPHRDRRIGLPFPGRWVEVLNTDALAYGGGRRGRSRRGAGGGRAGRRVAGERARHRAAFLVPLVPRRVSLGLIRISAIKSLRLLKKTAQAVLFEHCRRASFPGRPGSDGGPLWPMVRSRPFGKD